MSGTVVFAIVQKGKAKQIFSRAREAGSSGGTIFYARGTAPSNLLALLGFADSRKEMVLTLCEKEQEDAIFRAMADTEKVQGVVFAIDCRKSYLRQEVQDGEGVYDMETGWKMINVICNQGYSEEVMQAAREAGAGGGTVMSGRGTGTPEDVKFFGVTLVPEKEMLLILVDDKKHDAVFDAIVSLPCLKEKGSGIVYTMPVTRFKILGQN